MARPPPHRNPSNHQRGNGSIYQHQQQSRMASHPGFHRPHQQQHAPPPRYAPPPPHPSARQWHTTQQQKQSNTQQQQQQPRVVYHPMHHHHHHRSSNTESFSASSSQQQGGGTQEPSASSSSSAHYHHHAHPSSQHHHHPHHPHHHLVPVQMIPAGPHGYSVAAAAPPHGATRTVAVAVLPNQPQQPVVAKNQPQQQQQQQQPTSFSRAAGAPVATQQKTTTTTVSSSAKPAAGAATDPPAIVTAQKQQQQKPISVNTAETAPPKNQPTTTEQRSKIRITNWRYHQPLPQQQNIDTAVTAAPKPSATSSVNAPDPLVPSTAATATTTNAAPPATEAAIGKVAVTEAAHENTENRSNGTDSDETNTIVVDAPAPTTTTTTVATASKPPLPSAAASSSHQPASSKGSGNGIARAFQSAFRASGGNNNSTKTPAHPKAKEPPHKSPITMCFERMLGAAAAIKTPAGEKSMFSKTPAATTNMAEKPVLSQEVSSKGKKRASAFYNKRKIHPVDVETVRNRSNAKGNIDPFRELSQDQDLERLVILEMAKQRQTAGFHSLLKECSPQGANSGGCDTEDSKRSVSRIISEGFFWKDYPACELVLYNHMTEYYEISAIKKDYKVQQEFNNILVEQVHQAALDSGFEVDPNFDDKKLRDRIRCFFKTHLQNAKKRLATLQKHADAPENRALVAVFIRMVRNPSLTYEDSLAMANSALVGDVENANSNGQAASKTKKRRLQLHKTPSVTKSSQQLKQQFSNHHRREHDADDAEDDDAAMPQPQWNHPKQSL